MSGSSLIDPVRSQRALSRALPTLAGIATASPPMRWAQRDLAAHQAKLLDLRDEALERWWRIVDASGIDHRATVEPLDDLPRLGTAARMDRFERHARPLARQAVERALATAGVDAGEVTDVVVATCTGFKAPGLAVDLIGDEGVGLPREVRPLQLGFMGCFGGVAALRAAAAIAASDPKSTTVVLCVELCSLHLRLDLDPQNLVASSLFADGAAAAVVRGAAYASGASVPNIALGAGRSLAMIEHRESMSWSITDHGFAMTLSREVPAAIRRRISEFIGQGPTGRLVLPHPGGPGILDAVEAGLAMGDPTLDRRGIEVARRVLRDHGNLSSATILFVLEAAIRAGLEPPAELVAFGPGLAIDAIALERLRDDTPVTPK